MIKEGEKPLLGYYEMSNFKQGALPEISIGLYYVNDGTDGEFTVSFHDLSINGFCQQLHIFGDGVIVLQKPKVKKLLKLMEAHNFTNYEHFVNTLKLLGFVNMKELKKNV